MKRNHYKILAILLGVFCLSVVAVKQLPDAASTPGPQATVNCMPADLMQTTDAVAEPLGAIPSESAQSSEEEYIETEEPSGISDAASSAVTGTGPGTEAEQDEDTASEEREKTFFSGEEEADEPSDADKAADEDDASDRQNPPEQEDVKEFEIGSDAVPESLAPAEAENTAETFMVNDEPRTLTVEGEDYIVTATFGPEAEIPAEAELRVERVDPESKRYENRLQEAQEKLSAEAEADEDAPQEENAFQPEAVEPTIATFHLFDISFVVDEQEVEPAAPVQVVITMQTPQERDAETVTGDNTSVIHFDEKKGAELVENPTVNADENGTLTAEFQGETFSEYAVLYTVDFYYGSYEFHLNGGDTMKLSELFDALHMEEQAADVDEVEFSDPSLLEFHQFFQYDEETETPRGDWIIKSLKPFDTEETLTITFMDGHVVVLRVTDAQGYIARYEPGTGGTIKVNGTTYTTQYTDGTGVVIPGYDVAQSNNYVTAVPNNGYYFINWTVTQGEVALWGDVNGFGYNYAPYSWTNENSETIRPCVKSGTNIIRANFEKIRYNYTVKVADECNNMGYVGGRNANGNTLTESNHSTSFQGVTSEYQHRNIQSIVAYAKDGYKFKCWRLNGEEISTSSYGYDIWNNTFQFQVDGAVLEAVFESISFTVNSAGNGTVSVNNGQPSNSITTTFTPDGKNSYVIKANKDEGYIFDHWTRNGQTTDASGASLPAGETISAGMISINPGDTLTAHFKKAIDLEDQIKLYMGDWEKELIEHKLDVDKTAWAYDYDNRIYQIDFSTSSQTKAISPKIDLEFIVDTSRSMYFPATLEKVRKNGQDISSFSNISDWMDKRGDKSQVYYVISSDETATVYAIYHQSTAYEKNEYDNQTGWRWTDASYFMPADRAAVNSGTSSTGKSNLRGYSLQGKTNKLGANDQYGNVLVTERTLTGTVYTTPDGITRLDYLKAAMKVASQVVYSVDPDAQIGLVTFNKYGDDRTINHGFFGVNGNANGTSLIQELENNMALSGGTNQRAGLETGKELFTEDSRNGAQRVAVLITDGAPNDQTAGHVAKWNSTTGKPYASDTIEYAADQLANLNPKVKLYSIGLSMGMAGQNNVNHLSALATNNGGLYKSADDGPSIAQAIMDLVDDMVFKANLTNATITDTIDPAFYPVDKNGNPLQANRNYTTETGKTFRLTQTNDGWKVTWTGQDIKWPEEGGWNDSIYVKAKEDFLGGNTVKTNVGTNDGVTARGYTATASSGVTASGTFQEDVMGEFNTPYVNVDELSLNQNDTTWTVYLGTEVSDEQLKEQFKQLFNVVTVNEVVSQTGSDHRRTQNSLMQSENGFVAETFDLKSITGQLTVAQINYLVAGDPVTIPYTKYDSSRYGSDNMGNIVIRLTKTPSGSYETHTPSQTETYTLTVEYQPASVVSGVNYHTTQNKSEGNPTGIMTSENTHTVNVFVRGLQLTKTDMDDETITNGSATFRLFRPAQTGETATEQLSVGSSPVDVVQVGNDLTTENGIVTLNQLEYPADGIYYLKEIEAPEGYFIQGRPMTIQLTRDNQYHRLNGTETLTERPSGVAYNWDQTISITLDGENVTQVSGNDNLYGISVKNPKVYNLPSAGGSGTYLYTIFGVAMFSTAALLLAKDRRALLRRRSRRRGTR